MAFIDDYDFEFLKNEAENLVIKELGRQLGTCSQPICTCNECVLDMAAMALNVVKPLYRVSLLGTLYTSAAMDENAYGSSVREAVSDAIEKVWKNPSHELHTEESESESESKEVTSNREQVIESREQKAESRE